MAKKKEIKIEFNPHKLQKEIIDAFASEEVTYIVAKLGRRARQIFPIILSIA